MRSIHFFRRHGVWWFHYDGKASVVDRMKAFDYVNKMNSKL